MSIYSEKFKKEIFANKNTSLYKIFNLINLTSKSVLDIGCSSGYFGKFIKDSLKITVDGIEIDNDDYKKAKINLDKVYKIDIQELNWNTQIKSKYDTIILADVLEHTINPVNVLENSKKLLTPRGEILISVPNVTHQSIIIELLSGQWNYEKSGLLDKTHIHFFDQNELIKTVENSKLYIKNFDYVTSILPPQFLKKELTKNNIEYSEQITKLLNQEHAIVFQYIIKANMNKSAKHKIYLKKQIKPVTDWINEYQTIVNELSNKEKIISEQKQILYSKKRLLKHIIKLFFSK